MRARAAIRVLDSLVRPKLGSNASLLREWDIAKHIHRARTTVSAPSTSQPSAATTPTATPSTATPPTATPSTAVPSNSVTTATA
jgi:hypothetical protein